MNYIFPKDNWYIEINDDNREIVNNWKINQEYDNDLFENPGYRYVRFDGGGFWVDADLQKNIKISIEEFKKYILNMEIDTDIPIIKDSLNYLPILFKKLNIK